MRLLDATTSGQVRQAHLLGAVRLVSADGVVVALLRRVAHRLAHVGLVPLFLHNAILCRLSGLTLCFCHGVTNELRAQCVQCKQHRVIYFLKQIFNGRAQKSAFSPPDAEKTAIQAECCPATNVVARPIWSTPDD